MIKYRRFREASRPLQTTMVAFERSAEGPIYYAVERISNIFLQDVIRRYGIQAVRNFWKAIKADLAEKVAAHIARIEHEYDAIDLYDERFASKPRTQEQWCELLGVGLVKVTCADCGYTRPFYEGTPDPDVVWRCAVCFETWFTTTFKGSVQLIAEGDLPRAIAESETPLDNGREVRMFR